MFPEASFLGVDLYVWMTVIGVVAAMVAFRIFSGSVGISAKVFNLAVLSAVPAVILGYVAAALFQSYYTFLETGVFEWGAGATFYGGLIGAIVVYLGCYFGAGHFLFPQKTHIAEFGKVLALIMPTIALAHGFGRLGCLFEGCCYGMRTDSWIGIEMFVHGEWQKRVPVQLFEALFLFALFFLLVFLLVRFRFEYTASLYFVAYGVWRFIIEFFRDDERGASGIGALTPSQLTALILIAVGVAFFFFYRYFLKERLARAGTPSEQADERET